MVVLVAVVREVAVLSYVDVFVVVVVEAIVVMVVVVAVVVVPSSWSSSCIRGV